MRRWPEVLRVPGNLEVFERSTLGSKVSGRLQSLLVDVGSGVSQGDLLARVDDVDYRLHVAQAEAQVRQARALLGLPPQGEDDALDAEETTQVREARAVLEEASARLARATVLRSQGIATDAEYDVAAAAARVAQERTQGALQEVERLRAQLQQGRVALSIARQQLADTEIRAPFDGEVLARRAGRGDYLNAGSAVVELACVDPLRLRAEVPEPDAPRVRAGQRVRFTVDGDPGTYEGALVRVPPELNQANRSLYAEAEVQNAAREGVRPLRGGSFVRAEIVLDEAAEALAVPVAALRSFAGVDRVLVVVEGKVEERLVEIGRREGGFLEVLKGLVPGERVILEPGSLGAGRPVRVRE